MITSYVDKALRRARYREVDLMLATTLVPEGFLVLPPVH